MNLGFWSDLQNPILGLAPMDGVTDAAFRYVVAKYGHPAIIFTEFTSVEGIRAGAERLLDDFLYDPIERPIVAQLFGADPKAFYLGAVVVAALGFDGVDINMGCPAKNVTQHGAGAALIHDPERAQEIIRQTRAGAQAWAEGISLEEAGVPENIQQEIIRRFPEGQLHRRELPVSIKTRLGYDHVVIEEWIQQLLEVEPVAITVHGRTLKQLYTGEADWAAIAKAAVLVHQSGLSCRILGNGDVKDIPDALVKITNYGVDGVLVGRATFGNPWLFSSEVPASWEEKIEVALEQARRLDQVFNGKGFVRIRKHLLDYFRGGPEAKALRLQLMRVENLAQLEEILIQQ